VQQLSRPIHQAVGLLTRARGPIPLTLSAITLHHAFGHRLSQLRSSLPLTFKTSLMMRTNIILRMPSGSQRSCQAAINFTHHTTSGTTPDRADRADWSSPPATALTRSTARSPTHRPDLARHPGIPLTAGNHRPTPTQGFRHHRPELRLLLRRPPTSPRWIISTQCYQLAHDLRTIGSTITRPPNPAILDRLTHRLLAKPIPNNPSRKRFTSHRRRPDCRHRRLRRLTDRSAPAKALRSRLTIILLSIQRLRRRLLQGILLVATRTPKPSMTPLACHVPGKTVGEIVLK
jgi:hypothetical protein